MVRLSTLVNNTSPLVIQPLSGQSGPVVDPYVTPYATRGLKQQLKVIGGSSANAQVSGSSVRRTISGKLVSLFPEQMRKYYSVITCADVSPPVFDDSWIGTTVQVDCVAELGYQVGSSPARPVVPGTTTRTEGHVVYYRPQLIMIVLSLDSGQYDDWNASYPWNMELEEV